MRLTDQHSELMTPSRWLYVLVMSVSIFGQVLGARGESGHLVDAIAGYLKDEGQVTLEDRTIVYKAYLRDLALPAVFDAIATDSATGLSASTSKEDKFDDAQDAYQKAVANLLAILRQKGLMKDPNPQPRPTPTPVKEPEPKKLEPESEQYQNQPEGDPKPEDSINKPVNQGPVPDPAIKENQNENSRDDSDEENEPQVQQKNETIWSIVQKAFFTVVITAILELIDSSPLKTVTAGLIGVLLGGTVLYHTLGWNIFVSGMIAIAAFVFIEIVGRGFKILGVPFEQLLSRTRSIIKPAVFLLEVVPDLEGSYAAHKMKQANPTTDMLDPKHNYQMWSKKCKGQAFILNNSYFNQNKREGSEIDTANMKHLFEELGYKIVPHQDLNGQEIFQKFKAFASSFDEEGARYDSAVIVLMSHGDTGVISGTDGVQVKLQDLQRDLEPDKCPGLKNKPKMYFVQACRGKSYFTVPKVSPDGPSLACPAETSVQRVQKEIPVVLPDFAADIRDTADVHFAYATTEGYLSLRSNVHGSFFIQALCEVFFAYAHQDNLNTLMDKVTNRVHSMEGMLHDPEFGKKVVAKQTPECIKRLRKNIYFLPKYSKT